MAFTVCRAIVTPLLCLNFSLYMIAAALAGWALNETINHGGNWNGDFVFGDWSDNLSYVMENIQMLLCVLDQFIYILEKPCAIACTNTHNC